MQWCYLTLSGSPLSENLARERLTPPPTLNTAGIPVLVSTRPPVLSYIGFIYLLKPDSYPEISMWKRNYKQQQVFHVYYLCACWGDIDCRKLLPSLESNPLVFIYLWFLWRNNFLKNHFSAVLFPTTWKTLPQPTWRHLLNNTIALHSTDAHFTHKSNVIGSVCGSFKIRTNKKWNSINKSSAANINSL